MRQIYGSWRRPRCATLLWVGLISMICAAFSVGGGQVPRALAAGPTTLDVTTTADSVDGNTGSFAALDANPGADRHISLREAIQAANNTPLTTTLTIEFDLPDSAATGSVWTIALQPALRALPALTRGNITIDATSQIDSNGAVVIDGGNSNLIGDGITITSSNNRLRGLTLTNFFNNGVLIHETARANLIDACRLNSNYLNGLLLDGAKVEATQIINSELQENAVAGVDVGAGAYATVIGGSRAAGNDIRANRLFGVYIHGTGSNTTNIAGNLIHDQIPTTAGDTAYGVFVTDGARATTIGGDDADASNVIGGNQYGIRIDGSNANQVSGNMIGVAADGRTAAPNLVHGLLIINSADNLIGGASGGARNVIAANGRYGIYLYASTNNLLRGNLIGVGADGVTARGNAQYGIYVGGNAQANIIDTNVIAANGSSGVRIDSTHNTVAANLIGLSADASTALPNAGSGVLIAGESNVVGPANQIAQHTAYGIDIGGAATQIITNTITANQLAGVNVRADGVHVSGNIIHTNGLAQSSGIAGVTLNNANNTLVADNTIYQNGGAGVRVQQGIGNRILTNSITENLGAGITLQLGGNAGRAAPVISDVRVSVISGVSCAGCTVELFTDDGDEGRMFLGATVASTPDGRFSLPITQRSLSGKYVTGTTTDGAGNTSVFAAPFTVPPAVSPQYQQLYLPLVTS